MTDSIVQTLELVRASQGGDDDALNRLFERYYPRVRKVIRLRMGPKLREKLESVDILQEVFRTAFEGFERFEMRDEASFINWLSKIAARCRSPLPTRTRPIAPTCRSTPSTPSTSSRAGTRRRWSRGRSTSFPTSIAS